MKFSQENYVKVVKDDTEADMPLGIGLKGYITGFTGDPDFPYWVQFENGLKIGVTEDEIDFA